MTNEQIVPADCQYHSRGIDIRISCRKQHTGICPQCRSASVGQPDHDSEKDAKELKTLVFNTFFWLQIFNEIKYV